MVSKDVSFNVKFVGEVEKYPVLYNHTLPEYGDKELTQKAWKEVAAKTRLSVPYCKEKWRNIRSEYLRMQRRISKKKSAYYLADALEFCVPYMKVHAPLSPSEQKLQFPGYVKDSDDYDDNDSQSQESAPLSIQIQPCVRPQFCPSHSGSTAQKFETNSTSVSDLHMAEYFEAKRAKLCWNTDEGEGECAGSQKIDRQLGLRMFLLSLLPELEELDDAQIKLFKRRVFEVIDCITASGSKPSVGTTSLQEQQCGSSNMSQNNEIKS